MAITARARFHFLHIRQRLLVAQHRAGIVQVARREDHDRQVFVDQRVRPMLHLAGRIAFGVNVGDFFQLQRAFQRDGIVNAASQEEEVVRAVIFLRQVFVLLVARRAVFELARNARELVQQLLRLFCVERAAHLREVYREEEQRGELRGEGLGRSDADLRPGMRVDGAVWPRARSSSRRRCRCSVFEPLARDSRCAAMVSAVSPDCVMRRSDRPRRSSDRGSGTRWRSRRRPAARRGARS